MFLSHRQKSINLLVLRIMSTNTFSKALVKSAHKMICFSCNRSIEIGEDITQCIEAKGMALRKTPWTGGRWVHHLCAPTGISTYFQIQMWEDMCKEFPDTDQEDLWDSLMNHDYWIHQEKDDSITTPDSLPSLVPDSDTESDVSERITMIDSKFEDKLKKEVSELTDKLVDSLQWFKIYANDEQMKRVEDAIYTDKHLIIERQEFERITDEAINNLHQKPIVSCFY